MERKTSNRKELDALLDERQDIMCDINDLKHKVQKVENEVKIGLIKNGGIDLLSVNWSRLARSRRR